MATLESITKPEHAPKIEAPYTPTPTPTPTHKLQISLPSNNNIPNYPATVNVSCFTVSDMKTLIPLDDENYFPALVQILQNLCDYDVTKLTITDFQYLVIWIRTNSVGATAEFVVTCNCDNTFPYQVDLSKLPIKKLDSSYKEPFRIKYSQGELGLKLPKIKDYQKVLMQNEDDQWLYLMASTLNGDIEENIKFLNSLSPKDLNKIKMFIDTYDYGVDILLKAKCNKCGSEVPFILPFRPNILFWNSSSESLRDFRMSILP